MIINPPFVIREEIRIANAQERVDVSLARISADGQTITLNANTVPDLVINGSTLLSPPSYTFATLPTATTPARLARVSDTSRGLWMDTGSQWFSLSGEVVNVKEFGAKGNGTFRQNASISASSTTLTSTGFVSGDVGKLIIVIGAGASSATLQTTIATFISSTQVTLTAAASTTVSNALAFWGTDDTTAIQAAIDTNSRVYMPKGDYGFTSLKLNQGQQFHGAGINMTRLFRLQQGSAAPALSMTSGQTADHMQIGNFSIFCNAIGTHGIDLGTETPGTTDFAFGSTMSNIRVYAAPSVGVRIQSNAGKLSNIWTNNFTANGFPDTLSAPNSQAFNIAGTLSGYGLAAEGRYELDVFAVPGNFCDFTQLHFELIGNISAKDIISVSGNGNAFDRVLAINYGAETVVRRDLIRLVSGVQYGMHHMIAVQSSGGGSLTTTNTINDVPHTTTYASASFPIVEDYNSLNTAGTVYDTLGKAANYGLSLSGTYTPTTVAVANIDATVGSASQWSRVGNTVTVSGEFTADTTAGASTGTNVAIPLPIPSNFTARSNGNGTAFCAAINQGAQIYADTANDRMLVEWLASDTSNRTWSFQFAYQVL